MVKTEKFRMPAGIRNKLLAAVAMLLVSSIMMVSTTYAWFTLSTAPEVTGITTSVGANGNLEMALLDSTTFKDLTKITSAVGDSSAVKDLTKANITWGNLVDLSDASYGLQYIDLQPARLNFATTESGEGDNRTVAYDATKLKNVASLLLTPTYGKDGRVNTVDGATYATINNNGWAFDESNLTYGVRAIGTSSTLTAQEAGLIAAKAAYSSNLNSAKSAVQFALSTYGNALASAVTVMAMGSDATLTEEQETAVRALVSASSLALNYIDAAYVQVLEAYAASVIEDSTIYEQVASAIDDAVSYSDAVAGITAVYSEFSAPDVLTTAVGTLSEQKVLVSNAANASPVKALKALVDTSKVIVNGFDAGAENGAENAMKDSAGNFKTGELGSAIMNDGGAIVDMPSGSGVFAYVGSVAGNYSASAKVNIKYGDINLSGVNATMRTKAVVDNSVGTLLNEFRAAQSTTTTNLLTDTYGYALDFAFRTNASGSYLKLQTEGAQRVYGDSESAATQGGGSTMTFKATTNDAGAASLTDDQVKDLMSAIRVAFIDPQSGTVYGIASLDGIKVGGDGFIGELTLKDYTIDAKGVMTLTPKTVTEGQTNTNDKLMDLDQNTAKRLTVVVWLDGDKVDNGDVANAAQSLVGSMNLQFSSSATLIPMENTALKNMVVTYTEKTLTDGKYLYNGQTYTVRDGYKLYDGSDNMVYFAQVADGETPTSYTKLTPANYTTALEPVQTTTYTVKFDLNGAKNGEQDATMADVTQNDATYTLPTSLDEGVTAPDNKTFDGWSLEKNGTKIEGSTTTLTSETTTLYAVWKDTTP